MTENQVFNLHSAFVGLNFIVSILMARKVYFSQHISRAYALLLSTVVLGFVFIVLAVIISIVIDPFYPVELGRG
jgi:hypothetical protein